MDATGSTTGVCVVRIDLDRPIADPDGLAEDVRRAMYVYQHVTVAADSMAVEVRVSVGPTLALRSALDYAANNIVRALGPLGLAGKMVRRDQTG